ncbi:MAG: DUF2461 domain-containing protein [Saprospiraceae bacterium]|nr:DUF2461 domain-containing protein [Saprospiraceae bacterium]
MFRKTIEIMPHRHFFSLSMKHQQKGCAFVSFLLLAIVIKQKNMIYFSQDFFDFFSELTINNSRTWFQANKKRYEEVVKQPFLRFVDALLLELSTDWVEAPRPSKDYLMRIHRDIRFSKDKSPYKTHMAAHLSPHGRKEMGRPGFFMHVNHQGLQLYSGLYMLDKHSLMAVRTAICADLKGFDSMVSDKAFRRHFGEILGEKNKRIPTEFREAADVQPLLYNKQFYYRKEFEPAALLKSGIIKKLTTAYEAARPINAFLDAQVVAHR